MVPRDPEDDSFMLSFTSADADGIRKFFEEFGFVIVRDVLDDLQCEESIAEIWFFFLRRSVRKIEIQKYFVSKERDS